MAKINPMMMKWARIESGYDISILSTKTKIPEKKLRDAEIRSSVLTINQIRTVANVLRRPLASFYFDELPESVKIPDFRTVSSDGKSQALSPDARIIIREMLEKKNAAEELGKFLGIKHDYSYINLFSESEDPELASNLIRVELGYNDKELKKQKSPNTVFHYWRTLVEKKGILVFQVQGIPVKDFRGFNLAEPPFPLIVINSKDDIKARSFSLIHELCHIILAKSGICDILSPEDEKQDGIERFCHRVAAATLMEKDTVIKDISNYKSKIRIDHSIVTELANSYKVSYQSMLIRLMELSLIKDEDYRICMKYLIEKNKKFKDGDKGGGNYYSNEVSKMSPRFSKMVLTALDNEQVTFSEALNYLNVKLENFEKFRLALEQRDVK